MGGLSAERDVSMRSGLAIYQNLQEMGYDVVPVDVGRDVVELLKKEKIKFAFLALHGGTGENGAIQGMLDVLGIPYTGSGVLASALAMDKEASKKIFSYHGLHVAPFVIVSRHAGSERSPALASEMPAIDFPLPWVVKPCTEGSSIGVSIVKEESDLKGSLDEAFKFGHRVIIEKFIKGRELHIGVLGDRALGGVEVRTKREFYDYKAKYESAGMTEYIMPPEVDAVAYEKTKAAALKAHQSLGCSGTTRVDFILDESSTPYVLEVNTLPGMTATSLLPKIAKSAGLDFKDLIEEILRLAAQEKE